ncbi:L-lactate permease [Aerococcaceae bacterium DSM 111022]|nr:L-lactate permease [Aerococcaceae bacterium DSM 111022]
MDHSLPISILSFITALIPMMILLVLLVFKQMPAAKAGALSLVSAVVTSVFIFKLPVNGLWVSLGKGLWDSVEILLVVWTALLFYHVSKKAGAFKAIKEGIVNFSENRLFLILFFGWVFSSFLQGVSGFGAPIAIAAPFLISIGVKPAYSVIITLIATGWSNMFAAFGIGWDITTELVNLDNEMMAVLLLNLMLWAANIVGTLFVTYLYGKFKAIKHALPAILLISTIQGGGQLLMGLFNPNLSVVLPGIIAVGAAILLTKTKRYKEDDGLSSDSPIMENADDDLLEETDDSLALTLNDAFMPYYFLTVTSIIALGIPPITDWLGQFTVGNFSFAEITTGYQFVTPEETPYAPISIFTSAAFYLLISTIFAYFYYQHKGAYRSVKVQRIFKNLYSDAISPSLAVTTFLILSQVLTHSGSNTVLGLGIAEVSTPLIYSAIAPWIGIFGAFMTSSATSGNMLFVPIHESIVSILPDLSLNHMVASQSAGVSIGNAIGPSNVILGSTTAEAENETGKIYKVSLYYVLITGILLSVFSVMVQLLV